MSQSTQIEIERHTFATPGLILLAGFVSRVIIGIGLWKNRSDDESILGTYSSRYALALAANIFTTTIWLTALLSRKSIIPRLIGLNNTARYGLIALSGVVLILFWLLPLNI